MGLLTSFQSLLAGLLLFTGLVQARIMWSPTSHAPDNIAGAVSGNDWYKFSANSTIQPEHIYNSITQNQRLIFESRLNAATGSYAGMGFDWKSNNLDTNITAGGGVCLTYRAARPFRLNLVQYQSPNEDHYGKQIAAQAQYTSLFIPFSELAREGWGSNYAFNAARQQGFNIQYKPGIAKAGKDSSNTIEILQVGLGNVCDAADSPVAGTLTSSTGPFWNALTSVPAQAANSFGGTWQTYTDGISAVTPAAGNSSAMETLLQSTGAVGFEAALQVTSGNPYPYTGLSMNWRSTSSLTDISAQAGLCVTYRADQPVRLILEQSGQTHTNYHGISLPAQNRYIARSVDFSDFQQEPGWGYSSVLDLRRQTTLRFEYKSGTAGHNSVEILQVGFKGQCDNAKYPPQVLPPYDTLSSIDLYEGDPLSIPLSGLFQDRDDDTLSYQLGNTAPALLDAQIRDGKVTLTPATNKDGTSQFSIMATDSDGQHAVIMFDVHVIDRQLNPTAKTDNYQVHEDDSLTVADPAQGLLANDFDLDEDSFRVVGHSSPLHGTVTVDSAGTFTYIPDPDFNGMDLFHYTIEDATGRTGTATVYISVIPVNDPPTVTGSIADQGPYEEDFAGIISLKVPKASVVFADPDGDDLTFGVSTNGLVSAVLSQSTSDYQITLQSVPDAFGTAVVTLYAKDPSGDSVGVSFQAEITAVDDEPTLVNDIYRGVEDVPLVIPADSGLLANDLNPDRIPLSVRLVAPPESGTLELAPSGAFIYTPDGDWNGTDQFTYRLFSGTQTFSGEATVTLEIAAVNDAPVLKKGATLADRDTVEDFSPIRISLQGLYSDAEGDSLRFWADASPEVLVSIDSKTQELVIRSVANANGTATVRVTATDGKLASPDTLSLRLTIAAVNDAPVVRKTIPAQTWTLEGWKLAFALDSVFSDPDGDVLQYAVECLEGLLCEISGDSLHVLPESPSAGVHTVRLTATDPSNASRSTSFKITLTEATGILAHRNNMSWQQWLQVGEGVVSLVDSRGHQVQKFTLPVAFHSIQDVQRLQPAGHYYLRTRQGTWKLPSPE